MDHVRTGFRWILEFSFVYNLFQDLLGAKVARTRYVKEFIRPFDGAKILDIGCGTSAILDYLPENVQYFGFDFNAKYIAYAKKKYGNRGNFMCVRVNESCIEDRNFDIVLANAILHHLDDCEAERLIATAFSHLKKGGYLVTFDGVYIPNQSPIAKFIISLDRGQCVRTVEGYSELAKKCFSTVDTTVLTNLYRVPYTVLIMRCMK